MILGRVNQAQVYVWMKRNWALCIVFVAVVCGVIGIAWGIQQQQLTKQYAQTLVKVGKIHHDESAAQNARILKVLNEHSASLTAVKELQKEFTDFVNTAGPALESGQTDLLAQINALGAEVKALCVATPGCK